MHDQWALLRDVVQGLSGVLMFALGAFVASIRPRTSVTLAVATFAGAFGAIYATQNIFANRRELANVAFAAVVATHNVSVGTHFLEGTGCSRNRTSGRLNSEHPEQCSADARAAGSAPTHTLD